MASETITRNDLKAILNEVLPPIPSEYKKLLWTNSNPTASFDPTTINLDLTDYDEVEITFINYTTSGYRYYVPSVKCKVGEQGIVNGVFGGTAVESGAIFIFERVFNVYTDRIAFGNAAGCADNSSHAIRNEMGVPIEIYGIKYERVDPPQINAIDYVIEQGISGIWTYRKWNSGIAECWGKHTETLSRYATFGPFYGYNTSVAFPSNLFVSTPVHTYTASVSSTFAMPASGIGVSATSTALYALAAIDGTYECSFEIMAKGKWK